MAYSEDELIPLSALQHLLFCERQCALIHVERLWAENLFTAEGNLLHGKAHAGKPETRDGVRVTRGLPLQSFSLGISGQADVIEWEMPATQKTGRRKVVDALQRATSDERARWRVTPVEYKRGKPKSNDCDRVQLCAQAMCLEEMLGVSVPTGQLFYGQKRRRVNVECDAKLRRTTIDAAARLHDIIDSAKTPQALREKKCDTCSLFHLCLPGATSKNNSAKDYMDRMLE